MPDGFPDGLKPAFARRSRWLHTCSICHYKRVFAGYYGWVHPRVQGYVTGWFPDSFPDGFYARHM